MYNRNYLAPLLQADLSSTRIKRTTGATTGTLDTLNVCLDTQNLGSNEKAFINASYQPASAFSVGTGETLSFGVCLTPPANVIFQEDVPFAVELSSSFISDKISSLEADLFVGWIDSAGASIANGWNATHNLVSNPVFLNTGGYLRSGGKHTVMIRDIVSGGGDFDKFLCCGISLVNCKGSSLSVNNILYNIMAEYAVAPYRIHKEY